MCTTGDWTVLQVCGGFRKECHWITIPELPIQKNHVRLEWITWKIPSIKAGLRDSYCGSISGKGERQGRMQRRSSSQQCLPVACERRGCRKWLATAYYLIRYKSPIINLDYQLPFRDIEVIWPCSFGTLSRAVWSRTRTLRGTKYAVISYILRRKREETPLDNES